MHFGPEWMRTKGSSRPAPSPPLASSPAPPGNSTYSALVTPANNPPPEGRDVAHPFRYSKEEMLRIFKEGGGRGGLGLEVERWEGIVREVGYDPVGLKDMGDTEKKVRSFSTFSTRPAYLKAVALKALSSVLACIFFDAVPGWCRVWCSCSLARSTRKCADASRRISYRPSTHLDWGTGRSSTTRLPPPEAPCGSASGASWAGGGATVQVMAT